MKRRSRQSDSPVAAAAETAARDRLAQVLFEKEYVSAIERADISHWFALEAEETEDARNEAFATYERMDSDPEVSAAINLLKVMVLSGRLELVTAVSDKTDPAYARAQQHLEFCRRSLKRLRQPVRRTLWSLLDAVRFGHKIAEITLETMRQGEDRGKWHLRSIKVKNRKVVGFVVNAYLDVVGFVYAAPGRSVRSGQVLKSDDASILPVQKFMALSLRIEDEDPRGESFYKAARISWRVKQKLIPELYRFASLFGLPITIVKMPSNPQDEVLLDDNGAPRTNGEGQLLKVSASKAMEVRVKKLKNGFYLILPNGGDAKLETPRSDGKVFFDLLEFLGRHITTAILLQTLATREGQHDARAAAETHARLLKLLIGWLRTELGDCLQQTLRSLLVMNFGDEAGEFVPEVHLGDSERTDFKDVAEAVAALKKADFFDQAQLPGVDAMLNLKPRKVSETTAASPDDAQKKSKRRPPAPDARSDDKDNES